MCCVFLQSNLSCHSVFYPKLWSELHEKALFLTWYWVVLTTERTPRYLCTPFPLRPNSILTRQTCALGIKNLVPVWCFFWWGVRSYSDVCWNGAVRKKKNLFRKRAFSKGCQGNFVSFHRQRPQAAGNCTTTRATKQPEYDGNESA